MANWRHILTQIAGLAEGHLNTFKQALSQRWGDAPTCIVAYHGYGTSDCLSWGGGGLRHPHCFLEGFALQTSVLEVCQQYHLYTS